MDNLYIDIWHNSNGTLSVELETESACALRDALKSLVASCGDKIETPATKLVSQLVEQLDDAIEFN